MPRRYPDEFLRDVMHAARASDASVEQIARDFGVSKSALQRWMAQADIDDGHREGTPTSQEAELKALRKRTRELETENEILRRAADYFAKELPQKVLPADRRPAAGGIPVTISCRVLGFSMQAYYAWRANPGS